MVEDISESDCCGNGCAHCILDARPVATTNRLLAGKRNILLNYTTFRLSSKVPKALGIVQLLFRSIDNTDDSVLDIPPGHHVMMRVKIADDRIIVRPYSPYWSDAIRKEFGVLVNLRLHGPMTEHLRDMQLNDLVECRGPVGCYDIHDSSSSSSSRLLLLISQGVAVAPLIPIVEAVLHNEDDERRIEHWACFRDIDDICFRQRLHDFNSYWNYKGRIYLARSTGAVQHCAKYKETLVARRLDAADLRQFCENRSDRIEAVIAGTREFQEAFKSCLQEFPSIQHIHIL